MQNKLEFHSHPMQCVLKSEGHLKIEENLGKIQQLAKNKIAILTF